MAARSKAARNCSRCSCSDGLGHLVASRRARERAVRGHRHEAIDHLVDGHRLLDEVGGTQLACPVGQPVLLEPGEHRDLRIGRLLAHEPEGVETVHAAHGHVEQQQVGRESNRQTHRIGACLTFPDDVEAPRQPEPGAHERTNFR